MELKLSKFINDHEDWISILSSDPYNIKVKEDGNYYLLEYNQLDSDFTNQIVRECRGIIIRKDTFKPVCIPFFKFGNYGESYVDSIDWGHAIVEEKVDGSLIKMWFDDNEWHISTNGTIFASKANLSNDLKFKNFEELFLEAFNKNHVSIESFDSRYTYMFELVSPYNKIVVNYPDTTIYLIGIRNNETLEEIDPRFSSVSYRVPIPKRYNLTTLEECIEAAKLLDCNDEGFVVVDRYFHRNKIKSPAWVAAHHLLNNGNINKKQIINMIVTHEDSEFLNYFPEYTGDFNNLSHKMNNFIYFYQSYWEKLMLSKLVYCHDRKEMADIINSTRYPGMIYSLLDRKYEDVNDWFKHQPSDKIIEMLDKEYSDE